MTLKLGYWNLCQNYYMVIEVPLLDQTIIVQMVSGQHLKSLTCMMRGCPFGVSTTYACTIVLSDCTYTNTIIRAYALGNTRTKILVSETYK